MTGICNVLYCLFQDHPVLVIETEIYPHFHPVSASELVDHHPVTGMPGVVWIGSVRHVILTIHAVLLDPGTLRASPLGFHAIQPLLVPPPHRVVPVVVQRLAVEPRLQVVVVEFVPVVVAGPVTFAGVPVHGPQCHPATCVLHL